MANLIQVLQRYGKERRLAPGEVLCRQGTVSDGIYYLKSGRLGVYKEEHGAAYPLSEVRPGNLVGELGSATGWPRTATVRAEEESTVIHVSEADFHRALDESPALAAEVVCKVGELLTSADTARVSLDRSYRQAEERVQLLCSERERLEELLRLREELTSLIIHDLRNPLGVIVSGLQMLEHLPVAGTGLDYVTSVVEVIGRAARRMQRLVDTLLDMARLEEGAMALELQPLDLLSLLKEMVDEERPLAQSQDVVLESRLPESLPLVLADRDVLVRVLANLLDNALKFTPGGGQVWVEARPDPEGVRIEVVDTGPGIPVDERERIFEKFTQIRGRTGPRRGSGLGLAFCRLAVEAHGGRIWVEDGPGGTGSRFIFILPRAQ